MEKFAREISTWPDENAKTSLLLLKAILSGDEAEIHRHSQEMTFDQLKAVRRTLEELESEHCD